MVWRGRVSWAAAAAGLVCAAAAATLLFTVGTVYRLHVPLPYWDEWYTVDHFRRYAEGNYGLGDLASQHNEHRLLFPRLFFFADELLFDLSGQSNLAVTLLLQLVNALLLIGLMCRGVMRPLHRALLGGFVVLMLFTLRQEQNFSNGFQLQFVGVFTAGGLGALAYATALERMADGRGQSAAFFALAALACVVATYTMANGVLAGFVLVAMAVMRRAPWRVAAATLALSALLAAAFFHGYVPGGDSLPVSQALAHPLPYLRYLTAYLGNPVGSGLRTTQALGTLGLAMAGGAAWRVWTARTRDAASLVLLGIAGFMLASALATTYGRIALGTQQAFESRYATPSLLFWAALVLFWFPVAARSSRPALPMGALAVLIAGLSVAAVVFEATAWPELARRSTELRRVGDSLVSGLYDAEAAATYENATPDVVDPLVPFLRERRLAVFADRDAAALGHPLAVLGPLAGACEGTVAARADPGLGASGVRLSGTVRDGSGHRVPRRILVADASGTVVGFGSAAEPGRPPRLWTGYAKAQAGQPLHVLARTGDGRLCDVGSATVEPVPGG